MKRELLAILVCPVCKGPLDLAVQKEEGDDIVAGSLKCRACDDTYPIEDSIPNLLPRALRASVQHS